MECKVEGCRKSAIRRGQCWSHYLKDLKSNPAPVKETSQSRQAVYHRNRRKAIKADAWKPESKEYTMGRDELAEAELMARVMERGKVLSAMMRTPMCMWPAEWTEDL